MEEQYEALAAPMPTLDALLSLDGSIARLWETTVRKAGLSKDALNGATWVRSAVGLQVETTEVFHRPFCGMACEGWGQHILHACGVLVLALQATFRALVFLVAGADRPVLWHSSTAVTLERLGGSLHVSLHSEAASTWCLVSTRNGAAIVTRCGIVATSCPAARD